MKILPTCPLSYCFFLGMILLSQCFSSKLIFNPRKNRETSHFREPNYPPITMPGDFNLFRRFNFLLLSEKKTEK